mmetsp:Transcript_29230/g.49270  ORF Transcript_29230/g.49270 Transcript_29230/m.49270 type:complete len:294 (+) Transcript_29230:81-962(+)
MLAGKIGVVFGAANKRSIAWSVAEAWVNAGARVHVVCQSERFLSSLEKLIVGDDKNGHAASTGSGSIGGVHVCDVTDEAAISRVFDAICEIDGPRVDAVLHSIAHAPATAMRGTLLDTSAADFASAHAVSAYSLISIARVAAPLLSAGAPHRGDGSDLETQEPSFGTPRPGGGSITALTYAGSTRATPGYVAMGCAKASLEAAVRGLALELGPPPLSIRVNALSPGPISTLAARGISGFTELKAAALAKAPLRRTAMGTEVGAAACFLASDGAASITGQVIHIDGGLSAVAPH